MARDLLYLSPDKSIVIEVKAMNLKSKTSWVWAAGLGALLLAGPADLTAQGITIRFGRDKPLEGQRFTTMRGLAHRLDEAAQKAAFGAGDTQEERNGRMQQRFLWAINDFARQARSFHERLDRYQNTPWDVADEVNALGQRARQVSSQLRGARAFPETYDDWAYAVNTLNLMNRSLAGENVPMPAERHAYQPFDENSRYSDGRHAQGFEGPGDRNAYVTGPPLREFRRLASSLTQESDRAVTAAERSAVRRTATSVPSAICAASRGGPRTSTGAAQPTPSIRARSGRWWAISWMTRGRTTAR